MRAQARTGDCSTYRRKRGLMTPSVSRLGILHNLLDVRFIRGTTQFTAFIGGTIDR